MFWDLISSFWRFLNEKEKRLIEEFWEASIPFSYIISQNIERIKKIKDYNVPLELLSKFVGPISLEAIKNEEGEKIFISKDFYYLEELYKDPFFSKRITDYFLISENHNFIKNSDFSDWKDKPVDWELIGQNPFFKKEKDGILIKNTTLISSPIFIFANLKYYFASYLRAFNKAVVKIFLNFLDLNGNLIEEKEYSFNVDDNDKRHFFSFVYEKSSILIIKIKPEEDKEVIVSKVSLCQNDFLLPYTKDREKMFILKTKEDLDKIYSPYGLVFDNLIYDYFPSFLLKGNFYDYKYGLRRLAMRLRHYIKYLIEPTRKNLINVINSFISIPVVSGYYLGFEDLNNHFYEKRIIINEDGKESYYNLCRLYPRPLGELLNAIPLGTYFEDEPIIKFVDYDYDYFASLEEYKRYKTIPLKIPAYRLIFDRNVLYEQSDIPKRKEVEEFLSDLIPVGFFYKLIDFYSSKKLSVNCLISYERQRQVRINSLIRKEKMTSLSVNTIIEKLLPNYNFIDVNAIIEEQLISSLWRVDITNSYFYLAGDTKAGFWEKKEDGYAIAKEREADDYWRENENGFYLENGQ